MSSPWTLPSDPREQPEPLASAEPWPRTPVYRAAGHPLTWLLHLSVVAATLVAVLATHRPHRTAAVGLAGVALRERLDPGERVVAEAVVLQRHWGDLFRPTFGVLAATNRRLLFVGVAPPQLGARGDGVVRTEVLAFPYDTAFSARPGRTFFGLAGGAVVRADGRREEFITAGSERQRAAEVTDQATRRVAGFLEYQRREQRWRDSILALPPITETYRVQRGDALLSIARRFDLEPERLREMNGLADDRVLVGQTLVVRITPRQPGACPRELCGEPFDQPGPRP